MAARMSESKQPHGVPPAGRGAFFVPRMADALVERLARGRVYYGWYMVSVVFIVSVVRIGFNGPFFGIFMKPMSEQFGWTRAMTTGAVTLGTVMAAGLAVVFGRVLDRYGPRWIVVGACTLLGACYFGLSQIGSLAALYLVYSLGRSMMQAALSPGIMNTVVSKWFVRRRATAISIALLGSFLGSVALAPVAQGIIDNYGWRQAWAFFGVLTWVLVLIPGAMLLRRMPEDLGLRPDGDREGSAPLIDSEASFPATSGLASVGDGPILETSLGGVAAQEVNLTFREALHTVAFWLLSGMVGLNALASTGFTFHMVPHFTDVGISNTAAAVSISMFTITQALFVFVFGVVARCLGARRLLLGGLLTLVLGSFLIAQARTTAAAYLGTGVYGIGFASYMLLADVVWADFFGRRYLGSIRGFSMVFQLISNAVGSLLAAFLYDIRGNYDDAFAVLIAAQLAAFVMMLLARKPKRKVPAASARSASLPIKIGFLCSAAEPKG